MKPFNGLSAQDNEELLKFPAYISMLAANNNVKMDEVEKKAALKIAHIKTFSCDPSLTKFYKEASKVLEKNVEQLVKVLPKEKNNRESTIKKKLLNLEKVISKLGKEQALIFHLSMKSFSEHVSKAHHSVIEDFILPISIPGLTD